LRIYAIMLLLLFSLMHTLSSHHLPFEHAEVFGGLDLGYYYVDLQVGSLETKQTVIVDTGSTVTAFPCAGCHNCGSHMDAYFDYRRSNTSRVVGCAEDAGCSSCSEGKCHYYQGYTEGSSIAGFYVEDYVRLGDDPTADKVKFIFGCHDSETNLFRTQLADGIMGLAFGHRRGQTIIDALFQSHDVSTDILALCFGATGGFMTVGGYNASMHLSPLQTVPLYGSAYYGVKLQALAVDDHTIQLHPNEAGAARGADTIIDSGTTFVYLNTAVHDKLWSAFMGYCNQAGKCGDGQVVVAGEYHPCYRYDTGSIEDFFGSFPTIHLTFDREVVAWSPASYLFSWSDHSNHFCLGVYSNGGGGNVLGAVFMRGHDVIFNRANQTVSFATSLCDPAQLITPNRRRLQAAPQSPTEKWWGIAALAQWLW